MGRGFGFKDKTATVFEFCSLTHQQQFYHNQTKGLALTPQERSEEIAIKTAMTKAYHFAIEKGTTDIDKMSPHDRLEFFKLFYGSVCNNLILDDEIPF